MKILDIGKHELKDLFPKAEIVHAGITDKPTDTYDVIYCENQLQTLEAKDVPAKIKEYYDALNDRGEMWFIVPSLEWCAAEVNKLEGASQATSFMLFGPPDKHYRSGFSLMWLRNLVEEAGFIPRKVTQRMIKLATVDGEVTAVENVVVGWRVSQ